MTPPPIDVVHVYKDFWPVVGGIENHVRRLAAGLARDPAFRVRVLVTNTGRKTVREEIDGIEVIKAGRLATAASTPLSLALPWELSRLRPDLIHLHFPYPVGEVSSLLAGRGAPLLISYHSDIVRQRRLLRLYRPLLRRVLERADAIIVSNPRSAASSPFLRAARAKLRFVPFGIDPARYALTEARRAQAAAIRAALPGPITLFVGVLRYYKGVDALIDAMRWVPGTLVIVGDGPEAARWRARADAMPYRDRIVFRGRLSDEEVAAHYHAADVFALPSTLRAESFGIVLIEAMACGVPLVTTELGTGTSYVNIHGETGIVVPPGDPRALAAALRVILDDPVRRRRFGEAARRRLEQQFSETAMIERIKALYREVLAARARWRGRAPFSAESERDGE
ncbi:MAG: glycosyltransferase [Chloroflexota bacterium]|nr:glycosyltransferase [Dehalococcoidia bacterium]MDW8253113.1 glycosyltransferase [Chloroflexota bacterium]